MADLGPKKIGSNYQKLLQQDSTLQDGSGSAVSLNFADGKNISGSSTTTGSFGRVNFADGDNLIVFSGSATQTGSIGHIIASNNSIQFGPIGSCTVFNKANVDDLK